MNSTTAVRKTTKPLAAPPAPRLVEASAATPEIELDSSAMDTITSRADYIKALANCAACLNAVETAGGRFEGHELMDSALPSLNYVIMEMADQIVVAGDRLWQQYTQALSISIGEVQS